MKLIETMTIEELEKVLEDDPDNETIKNAIQRKQLRKGIRPWEIKKMRQQ